MTIAAITGLNLEWRRAKSAAFDLLTNSTARGTVRLDLWGREVEVYANANLSIYSAQRCNAACRFCVEELRPASRGMSLHMQKQVEMDDGRYFSRLGETLQTLRPLCPTLSITGGEPSKDPRLPRILEMVARTSSPRKTMTTNGSGLLDYCTGKRVIDLVAGAGLDHLNISVAHPELARNAGLMQLSEALTEEQLREIVRLAAEAGVRVRLSCVLLREGVCSIENILAYLAFARRVGVDNVIFRQLMKSDPATHAANSVVRYSDAQRVPLEPLLDSITERGDFAFVRQVMGYYYYVEVWRHEGMDVVFEEADLGQLEQVKRREPEVIHELVFHPNGRLASTWQPWDGVLGPADSVQK